ncbi:hypothetical protein BD779DRAFT_1805746 [Infundibulicybe gibba]|nr:hypothetical protein BD779DRAFT_1805746 [Infundibulicybe gibba]
MCPPSLAAAPHAFDDFASTSSFAPPTDVALAPNHHRHALALPPHPQLVARRAESPVPPPPRLCSQLKRPAARGLCHRRQPPAPVLPQLTQALGAFGRATTPDFNTTDSKKTGCCNLCGASASEHNVPRAPHMGGARTRSSAFKLLPSS